MIDKEIVKKLALLSRIEIKDNELDQLTKDLQKILNYVEELKNVDTEGLPEITQVTGLKNVTRKDELSSNPQATPEEILERAPMTEKGFVKVKAIFE